MSDPLWAIPPEEVAAQLRALLSAERPPLVKVAWHSVRNGTVEVCLPNGWQINIFNDSDHFDGVHAAHSPDGRSQLGWFLVSEGRIQSVGPSRLLTHEEIAALEQLLRKAPEQTPQS